MMPVMPPRFMMDVARFVCYQLAKNWQRMGKPMWWAKAFYPIIKNFDSISLVLDVEKPGH